VGTEAALLAGAPLVNVDESAPLRPDSPALYGATKARAEQLCWQRIATALRPSWCVPDSCGAGGDTTLLPTMTELARSGRFAWIAGGHHRTSTTHVDNAVERLLLGASRGSGGNAYFVADGEPLVFRDFVTQLLATQGVPAPTRSIPESVARGIALVGEGPRPRCGCPGARR
jgi:nucleoside-diphosphate-sugar epimerase